MKAALEKYKEEKQYEKALSIVKYQNFKTKVALQKIGSLVGRAVFEAGVVYIKRGKETAPLSTSLKSAIDQIREECVQPLRPTEQEARKWRAPLYEGKNAKPPVSFLPVVNKKLTSVFEYGVLIDDCIKLFESEKDARMFCNGVRYVNCKALLVEVEKKVIE